MSLCGLDAYCILIRPRYGTACSPFLTPTYAPNAVVDMSRQTMRAPHQPTSWQASESSPSRVHSAFSHSSGMPLAIVPAKLAKEFLLFASRCPIRFGAQPAPNLPLSDKACASMRRRRRSATITAPPYLVSV